MATDPRWAIRPRQRGRYGVPGLHLPSRPTATDMAFDKLVISVSGTIRSATDDDDLPLREIFEGYRRTLQQRAEEGGRWRQPRSWRVSFRTELARPWGSVSAATIRTSWADDVLDLTFGLTVNPTRVLIHALTMVDSAHALEELAALPFEDFFALSGHAASATTLDGRDNAFDHLDELMDRMGRDHAGAFIGIFEDKLKQWALEAVAPRSQGFRWTYADDMLLAESDTYRVAVNWRNLFLRSAEVYCERRHGDAVGLMNRLSSVVLAAHAEADWRTYPIDRIGGRAAGSTVLGVRPTGGIEQVFYAKTRDRVRIETRYHHRVRDNLRQAVSIPACNPLQSILLGLRADAVARLQWDNFCTMAEEPPIPMMPDFARLVGVIARCSKQARVDPEPVIAELIGAGGISETPHDGAFPRRLMRRLQEHGLITRESLIRRARPGHPRRHHLTQPYLSIAQMVQRTFANPGPTSAE